MKLTIFYQEQANTILLELFDDDLVQTLKSLIESELKIPSSEQVLMYNNAILEDSKKLSDYGIKDSDLINLNKKLANQSQAQQLLYNPQSVQNNLMNTLAQMNQSQQQAYLQEAQNIKQHYMANPQDLEYILHQNRALADLVLQDDIQPLVEFIKKKHEEQQAQKLKEINRINQLESDPLNPDNQKEIEKIINKKQIDDDREYVLEYMPEFYSQIPMLYIEILMNKVPIQAFVDSGAQQTIISKSCLERCNLMHKLDEQCRGIAIGVGTSNIVGRIHKAEVQILDKIIQCPLIVLEDDKCDFLLGLDTLRRFQCVINLATNSLSFTLEKEIITVKFLSEGEIHKKVSIEQEKILLEQEQKMIEEEQKSDNSHSNKQNKPLTQTNQSSKSQQQPQQLQQQLQQTQQQQQQKQFTTSEQSKQSTNKPQNNQFKPARDQRKPQQQQAFKEQDIQKLIELGASSRDEAIRILQLYSGNIELACSYLFQKKFN